MSPESIEGLRNKQMNALGCQALFPKGGFSPKLFTEANGVSLQCRSGI